MTSIPAATRISDIVLRVRNLEVVAKFYREGLGLKEVGSITGERRLSANGLAPAQIVLLEDPKAPLRQGWAPGLFHTAFLFPSRGALASTLQHLIETGVRFQGFADHGVSEAVYLADPEGNGIELYRDRPRETWPTSGKGIEMTTEPLDVAGLLREAHASSYELDRQMTIGHLHLQVSDLGRAEQFYHKNLRFDVTQRSYPGALFMSAGGYHHHLGFNVWNSRNSVAVPGVTGLVSFGILLPDGKALEDLAAGLKNNGYPFVRTEDDSLSVSDFDRISVRLHAVQSDSSSLFSSRSQEVEL